MNKELKEALRLITKVQADPRLGPDEGEQLRRAKRELKVGLGSGKLDRESVFRAVAIIATVMQHVVERDVLRTSE